MSNLTDASGLAGRIRLLITLAIVASVTVVIAPFTPTPQVTALDALQFTSVKGVWDESPGAVEAAETTDPPPCLVFGRDWSSSNGSFREGQNTNPSQPTVRNQVRFGYPSGEYDCDDSEEDDRSGFGFAGVSSPSVSGLFEIGRFTHFNRPIRAHDDNAGTAILDATFRFNDETTSPATPVDLTVEYEVKLHETPNNAEPCEYVTGGSNVPPGVTVDNRDGCADRIQVSVANEHITRTIGQTDITFEIGGFGAVSGGSCGTPQANGNVMFTREGGARQACIFAQPARGTLIVNKQVDGGGSGSYPIRYQEISQKYNTRGQATGSAVSTNVAVTNGSGTTGPISLAPGLYNLTELTAQLGGDVDFASVTCTTDKQTATLANFHGNVTTGANVVVDLDSNETITCTYTNRKPAKITIVKDAQPNAAQSFEFSTTSAPGSPNSPKWADLPTQITLDDDGIGANSFTQLVDAGTYTITEAATAGWRLDAAPTCVFTVQRPGSTATGNLATRTATLNLTPGSDVTCTFVNAQVPPPEVTVEKTRNPGSFTETDGTVTYGVAITNSGTEPIRVTELRDLILLDGADASTATDADLAAADPASPTNVGGDFIANTCDELVAASAWIGAGDTVNCSFTIAYTGRDAGEQIDDTVTVTVVDELGRTDTDDSSASVDVTDRLPVIVVDKTAVVETVAVAPGGPLTYDVTVHNGTRDAQGNPVVVAYEPITITAVTDQMSVDVAGAPEAFTPFGPALDITTATAPIISTTCNTLIGTVLAPYASTTCRFVVDTTSFGVLQAGDVVRNTVAVTAADDDGNDVTDDDDADRDVVADAPEFQVFKTDGGAQIVEPGTGPEGQVTYTFLIDNVGQVGINEPLTITGFSDVVSYEGAEIGTITIPGPAPTFTRPGVSLITETCSDLIGTTLYPATGTYQMPGIGSDSPYTRSAPASGQPNAAGAECTVSLQLPGNAGEEYTDDVFVSAVEGIGPDGTPLPDATDDADTPIVERPPSVTITKTPSTTTVPETGGEVTFTFVITNTSGTTDPLTITGLSDDPFGDLLADGRTDTDCGNLLGVTIVPGGHVTCQLTVTLTGDAPDVHRDVVTVNAVDDEGTPASDDDDAEVTFTDVLPAIDVTKTAIAVDGVVLDPPGGASVSEFGGDVTFRVVVANTTNEAVTLTDLVDEVDGVVTNLDGIGTCAITASPIVLAPAGQAGDTYTCDFTLTVVQANGADSHDNTVTATAVDDEGNEAHDDDDEVVTFITEPPVVTIDKDDRQASVSEPGGTVTYYLEITNGPDAREAITGIQSLTDTITYSNPLATLAPIDLLADADADGNDAMTRNTCPAAIAAALPLAPGASFTCEFDIVLSGTAQFVDDTVRIVVTDDDGEPSDPSTDDETTPIIDVPIDFSITKTADTGNADPLLVMASNPAPVTYNFEVVNQSTIEELYLVGLTDDKFGDLSTECGWTIATPVILQPNGTAGDRTTCVIQRSPTMPDTGSHWNVATAIGGDDEIYNAITDDDDTTVATWIERADTAVVHQEATITVIKEANPPTAPFTFQLDGQDDRTATPNAGVYAPVMWDGLTAGTYEVTELVPTDWTLHDIDCTLYGAHVDFDAVTDGVSVVVGYGDDVVCTFTNLLQGEVTIDKALTSGPTQQAGTNRYDLTYTITITNDSYDVETYRVFDELEFPVGSVEINSITADGATVDQDWDGTGELTDGVQTIPGRTQQAASVHTITVGVTVTLPGATATGGDCLPDGERIRKVVNSIFDDATSTDPIDSICTELPDPEVTDGKSVVEDETTFADGVWTIVYDITVSNIGSGPGSYSISDTLGFGAGIDVADVTAVVHSVENQISPAWPTTATSINPDFDPDPTSAAHDPQLLNGEVEIVAGATHVYRITVTATVPFPAVGAGECDPAGATAGGFLNTATVTVNGTDNPPVSDCEPFNTLTLEKVVVNDDGGEATAADFVLTATPEAGGNPVVEGTGLVVAAVPAGVYDLAEPITSGYAASGWTCTVGQAELPVDGATATTGSVTIALDNGDPVDVYCVITNDDAPVDLELTKSDGGATAVAGGPAFPYTITVTNVGDRAVDLGEPVTVVDVLPAGFAWVSFPSDPLLSTVCAIDGTDPNVLRCDLDPAQLGIDEQVVIATTVRALPDTPSGTYTNDAWVTTEDDPVCDPQTQDCDPTCVDDCTPPPCPDDDVPGSNVGCDDTPVDPQASLAITKSDDVDEPVANGETYGYTLTVANNGPSTVTDVVVTDDLPDGLVLVGVTANPAHWTCNTVDPIECTYNTALAAGPAASAITVTVRVADDAVFADDVIVNVAVANGELDDEPLPEVTDDEETPLLPPAEIVEDPSADLVIEKTASIAIVSVGNAASAFYWTLDVRNDGPDTAVDVIVRDVVPAPLTVTRVMSDDFDCAVSGRTVTCTRDQLAVGAGGTVTIDVSLPATAAAGSISNVGTVESDTPDPDETNNSDDAQVDVVRQEPPVVPPAVVPPAVVPPANVPLPRTGSSVTGPILSIGAMLLALGALGVTVAKRRRTRPAD